MTVDAVYLLQLTLNGIALGLLYALIAVGLSLIFGVMEIINFAHGELSMLGAFAMTFALPVMGLLYWPALAVAILAIMLVGFVIYELLLVRLKPDEFERSILITLGLSIIIIHVVQYVFTATPRMVDTQYGFEGVQIGSIRITWTRIIGAGAALAALAASISCCATPSSAAPCGRSRRTARRRSWWACSRRVVARNAVILAAGLCGLAGAAISPIQLVTPYIGQLMLFKAFALVIIGGLGNIPGAIVAAIESPGRKLDRRLLRDRLAGGRRLRDHDRGAVRAARRAVQARGHARRMKVAVALIAALALAALPLLTSSNYIVGVAISALIFTVAAAALNLVYGFTGLLSFAQLGFWGIGGYVAGPHRRHLRRQFLVGLVWAALHQCRRRAGVRLSNSAHQSPRLRHRDAHLRPAGRADRARLGRSHPRTARHPRPAAALGLRLPLRHYPPVLLGLSWAFSVAMLAFLYVLCSCPHRPHPDRHQAE